MSELFCAKLHIEDRDYVQRHAQDCRKEGLQALSEIKAEPSLQHIPIVILTSSEELVDIDFTMIDRGNCILYTT
jgi:CheY-like chemotaxis protein